MKKLFNARVIFSLLVLLLITSILPATAFATSSESYTFVGTIVPDETITDPIDFSAIEIKIYQAVKRENTPVEGIVEYDASYSCSVYPNLEGVFTVTTSFPDFSLAFNINTLPDGVGIKQRSGFFHADVTHSSTFTLSAIDHAELTVATLDETPLVTLFNRNEEKVFAPVEFSPRFSQRSDNPNGVTVSGTVLAGNSTAIDVSSEIDLDAFDDVDRIEQLYSAGLLSDAARIDTYLDLIESGSLTLDCIPYVMNVCNQYYETQNLSQVAVENINTVYSAQSAELDTALAALTDSNESDHFKLYYDSTDVSSSVATKILNFLEDMYDISVSLGFRTPVLESGFSKTRVYIDTGANPEGSGRGYTYAVETNGNHAASYITIWNFRTSNSVWSQWKETIAHEYFHAVQYAYYYHANWFREASAVWFAAKYSGSITRAEYSA